MVSTLLWALFTSIKGKSTNSWSHNLLVNIENDYWLIIFSGEESYRIQNIINRANSLKIPITQVHKVFENLNSFLTISRINSKDMQKINPIKELFSNANHFLITELTHQKIYYCQRKKLDCSGSLLIKSLIHKILVLSFDLQASWFFYFMMLVFRLNI